MKRFFTLFFVLTTFSVFGQNLVPNPSFEEFIECPDGEYDIDLAFPWTSYRQTPDYFNICDETNGAGVPYSSIYGYQYPYHGVGQAGLIAVGFPFDREIIGAELISPLEIGMNYYISFYANRGFGGGFHSNCNCAVNNLGVKFTNQPYSVSETVPIDNNPHFYFSEVITDTVGWEHVSGAFTADSAYTHLALGNFFEADFNTVENYNNYEYYNTYYFIDAVCITKTPSDCDALITGINDVNATNVVVTIYPNPASTLLNIHTDLPIVSISVMTLNGKQLLVHNPVSKQLNISNLPEGMYVIIIKTERELIRKKFIKT